MKLSILSAATSQRTATLNRKKGLETRQRTLDRKLLAGTVRDEEYRRLQDQILSEIEAIDGQMVDLDRRRAPRLDLFDRLREIVLNLPNLYVKAPDEGKRLYLTLFWNEFIVKDGQISSDRPSELLAGLLEAKKALTDSDIHPGNGGNLPPPASKTPVLHRSSNNGRQGSPNGHTSNALFRQFTEHSAHLGERLRQLHPDDQNHLTSQVPSFQPSSK